LKTKKKKKKKNKSDQIAFVEKKPVCGALSPCYKEKKFIKKIKKKFIIKIFRENDFMQKFLLSCV